MADFTLFVYNGTNTNSTLGKVNFLKKRHKEVMSDYYLMIALEDFIKNSPSIEAEYISEMKEIFEEDEVFHFLVPVSSCNYFVNKIKGWILNGFVNAIDLSDLFSEREEINMARNGKGAKQNFKENIIIEDEIKDYKITKLFIGDDVYNTGTSIEVYKELITEKLNDKIEFSHGTLIKIQ